jgi:hypothetical protein
LNQASFIIPSGTKSIGLWFKDGASITSIMLNEGSHPLPYQPYEGEVVHEKELTSLLGSLAGDLSTNANLLSLFPSGTDFSPKIEALWNSVEASESSNILTYGPSFGIKVQDKLGLLSLSTAGDTAKAVVSCYNTQNANLGWSQTLAMLGIAQTWTASQKFNAAPIFNSAQSNSYNNAEIMLNNQGEKYCGIGCVNGVDGLYFSPCNADGTWYSDSTYIWNFLGNLKQNGISVATADTANMTGSLSGTTLTLTIH